jgi:tellurite resistance protein TerC
MKHGLWGVFALLVAVMLVLDLGVFHRRAHVMKARHATLLTLLWVLLAFGFCGLIYWQHGGQRALWFLQGWLVEEALSVDNLFAFLLVFRYFAVPSEQQHRVLFWGVLGAMITRGVFIGVGTTLLNHFAWLTYVFGGFLVLTALRMASADDSELQPEKNPVLRLFKRFVPMTGAYEGSRFMVRRDGRLFATPLLLVLVVLEATDVVFAVDSIPAVFAITTDIFVVYTSNIFAVLGLRALCAVVAHLMDRLRFLKVGLAFVLVFIGGKMLLARKVHVPEGWSLAVVAGVLLITVLASVLLPEKGPASAEGHDEPHEQSEPGDPAASRKHD